VASAERGRVGGTSWRSLAGGAALALTGFGAPPAARADETPAVLVKVSNPLPSARQSETITLPLADLRKATPSLDARQLIVLDGSRDEVLSQLVDMDGDEVPDNLVFQAEFASGETKIFTVQAGVRRAPSREQYRVYGRFVRERHDDFAWENDRIAHRMYGPDLESWKAEPLTSSGVDVWTKRVRNLVVNDWYLTDDYHHDHGEGADLYSVGKARGCGGLGIYRDGKLAVSRNFIHSRVFANGPIRLIFELSYAPWDAGGAKVSETKRVTLDAGQNFDRFESRFLVEDNRAPVAVGIGIAKHTGGTAQMDKRAGWLRSWEPLRDANGNLGCAIVVLGGDAGYQETDKDFILTKQLPGDHTMRYFAGFGWDRSGDFPDAAAWARAVERKQRELATPLRTELSAAMAKPLHAPLGITGRSEAVRMVESLVARAPSVLTPKWEYDTGMVLMAMARLGRKTNDSTMLAYVKRTLDGMVDAAGNIKGYQGDAYNIDDINAGKVLFGLFADARGTDKERYRKAIELLRLQMKTHPRIADGAFWHKKIYPHQMWLDGVYMASPFLAEYAATFGEPALFDDVARQILLAEQHMRDRKTGLLFHGWDANKAQRWADPRTGTSSQFWGRAMGWYAMAIVDVLEWLPEGHPQRGAVVGVLERLAAAIAGVQDRSTGVWWQILDQPKREGNYLEASASSMFVYALSRAVNKGWLDKSVFGPVAALGYRGLVKQFIEVRSDGQLDLTRICKVAGLGGNPYRDGSYAYYTGTQVVKNDPKGEGAFLLAAIENE